MRLGLFTFPTDLKMSQMFLEVINSLFIPSGLHTFKWLFNGLCNLPGVDYINVYHISVQQSTNACLSGSLGGLNWLEIEFWIYVWTSQWVGLEVLDERSRITKPFYQCFNWQINTYSNRVNLIMNFTAWILLSCNQSRLFITVASQKIPAKIFPFLKKIRNINQARLVICFSKTRDLNVFVALHSFVSPVVWRSGG